MRTTILTATAAAILAAATNGALAQTPKRGGVFTHYMTADPPNLDCHQSISIFLLGPVRPIYSGLVRYDQNNYPAIVGDLAESWTVAPDGLTYTFKLRQNVKFHDGSILSSADVKASFDRIKNPPSGAPSVRQQDFVDVASIEAPDPQTVVFKLARVNSAMLDLIANPFNCIYSARKLQATPLYPATEPMGTGAFQFTGWTRGSEAGGKRFDGYFRPGLPYLDAYRLVIISEPSAVNAISGGQIDGSLRALPPQSVDTLKANLGDKVSTDTKLLSLLNEVTPNIKRKPYDDVRVRRALSIALDRREGVELLRKISVVEAVGGFVRPGFDLALTDAELEKLPGMGRDPNAARAEARRLLAEAGQSNLVVKLLNQNTGSYATRGVWLVDQWTKLGLKVEHDVVEGPVYVRRSSSGDFDIVVDANSSPSDDPTVMMGRYIPGSANNMGGIDDPKVAELFQRQKSTLDRVERKKLVNELDRLMIENAYIIPNFWARNTPVLRSYVKGWTVTSNFNMGYDLTEVWLDK